MAREFVKNPRRIRPAVAINVTPDPIGPALLNNIFLQGGRNCTLQWYQERVRREVLKYLRHETTNYDALRSRYGCHQQHGGYVPTEHAEATIAIIRAKVEEAIAKAYPNLDRDMEAAAVRLYQD